MKVVLFCGGLGTRLREHSDVVPKPLVNIGERPIVWHLMKYYDHFGHKEFVMCLGYRGDLIREYFLNYNECLSNDFLFSRGGKQIEVESSDIDEWSIRFVDTGLKSNLGQRLLSVKRHLEEEEVFLANYSDGLTDLALDRYIDRFLATGAVASFVAVRPSQSFHSAEVRSDGVVTGITHVQGADFWINGGFFVFRREIFDYIRDGEDIVDEPFQRLIQEEKLLAEKYEGFWAAMDTFKDKKRFDSYHENGVTPWQVWRPSASRGVIPEPGGNS